MIWRPFILHLSKRGARPFHRRSQVCFWIRFDTDHMIDILKTFPQGEEKEKLLFAFTQSFCIVPFYVDGVTRWETHS